MYDTVDWELGPCGKHLHTNCRLDTSSSDKLYSSNTMQQIRKRESASLDKTHDSTCYRDQDFLVFSEATPIECRHRARQTSVCACGVWNPDTKHSE